MAGSRKLVYIINSLGVGGSEMGMCRLLDGLDENKYDVTVIVLDGKSGDGSVDFKLVSCYTDSRHANRWRFT